MRGRSGWWVWCAGGILGALGVAAGAFAAHGFEGHLSANEMEWWQTAARYQSMHAIALLMLATVWRASRWFRIAAGCWVAGILIFAGTLYALALDAPRWLGAVTPLGGSLLILGWAAVAWGGWRMKGRRR